MNKKMKTQEQIQKKVDNLAKAGIHIKVGNIEPSKKYVIIRNVKNKIYKIFNIIENIVIYMLTYILLHILIFGGNINIHLNNPIEVIKRCF